MDIDDQAAVEAIVLAIEIEGPGRQPPLFDDFSTFEGDRRLAERLDQALDGVCTCGRSGKTSLRALFDPSAPVAESSEPTPHVCQIIPFPRRPAARRTAPAP